jgi:hypothetical protein
MTDRSLPAESTSRNVLHQVHTTRSQEPMLSQPRQSPTHPTPSYSTPALALNVNQPPTTSAPSSARSQKITPPSTSVSSRSESLSNSPEVGRSDTLQNGSGDMNIRSFAGNPSSSTKPTMVPRKSHSTDSGSTANGYNSSNGAFTPSHGSSSSYPSLHILTQTPPPQPTQFPPSRSLMTPLTAPAGLGFSDRANDGSGTGASQSAPQVQGYAPNPLTLSQSAVLTPNPNVSALQLIIKKWFTYRFHSLATSLTSFKCQPQR